MENSPFFSVIIPTYNRENTIIRAVDSVFNQSFKNFELIIIDDGSIDRTEELLKNYDLKFFRIKNSGVSYARNFGVSKSKANWLCFLDSDDEWESVKLAEQYKYIQENPSIDFIHTNETWWRNGQLVKQASYQQKGGGDQFARSCHHCLIAASTVALKRSLYEKYGGFREDFPVCEDYDLWLKIASDIPVGFIEKPLSKKHAGHENQLSFKFKAMDFWRVQSLDWVLKNKKLSSENSEVAKTVLLKKCEILLAGHEKHGRTNSAENLLIKKIYSNYNS